MTITTMPQIDPKRLERGRAIFAGGGVTQIDASTFQISSQTGSGYHLVTLEGPEGLADLRCSCPDYMGRSYPEIGLQAPPCKHGLAVALSQGWLDDEGPPSPALQVLDEDEGDDDDGFSAISEVNSRMEADALLWQIGQLQGEIDQIDQLVQQEIDQITRWQEREKGKLSDRIGLFTTSLEAFLRREERKSISLPHGRLQLRKVPDRIIVDEEQFDWSREEFVKVIPEQRKPDTIQLRKHLKATGELLPGVDIEPGEVRFSLKAERGRKEQAEQREAA